MSRGAAGRPGRVPAGGLECCTEATVTDPGVLQRELDEVLRRGRGADAAQQVAAADGLSRRLGHVG